MVVVCLLACICPFVVLYHPYLSYVSSTYPFLRDPSHLPSFSSFVHGPLIPLTHKETLTSSLSHPGHSIHLPLPPALPRSRNRVRCPRLPRPPSPPCNQPPPPPCLLHPFPPHQRHSARRRPPSRPLLSKPHPSSPLATFFFVFSRRFPCLPGCCCYPVFCSVCRAEVGAAFPDRAGAFPLSCRLHIPFPW